MNRFPRRTVRVQPPLRGRLAAVASPKQRQKYSEPVVSQRPLVSKSYPKSIVRESPSSISDNSNSDDLGKYLIAWVVLFLLLFAISLWLLRIY